MPSERYAYYLDQCRIHHATRKTFSGRSCLKHRSRILTIAAEIGATSALDYGCGKGNQYVEVGNDGKTLEQALGFEVAKYDPAVPAFEQLPEGAFDFAWCTDVLEHVPAEDIAEVLQIIGSKARKACFFTVGCYPAKKNLPNGENAHVTVKPPMWWGGKFAALRRRFPELRIETLLE